MSAADEAKKAAAAALDDPAEDPMEFLLSCLWDDLNEQRHRAYGGGWSMGCDNVVREITILTLHLGKPLDMDHIPIPLLLDGVYEAIHEGLGMPTPISAEELEGIERAWEDLS